MAKRSEKTVLFLCTGNYYRRPWAEFCYRTGGETVYVCSWHPNGVTTSTGTGRRTERPWFGRPRHLVCRGGAPAREEDGGLSHG